jgi:hypothetical protein
MSVDAEAYMYAFRDVVYELVDRANKNEGCDDPGYRAAMLHVLGLLNTKPSRSN